MDIPPPPKFSRWLVATGECVPITPKDGVFTLEELQEYVWLGEVSVLWPENSVHGLMVVGPQDKAFMVGAPLNQLATEVMSVNRIDRTIIPIHGHAVLAWRSHLKPE